MKIKQWILEAVTFLTALLFLYTACSKLFDIRQFEAQIDNQVFEDVFTPFLTYGIPITELFIAVLLVLPKTRAYGFATFTILMTAFTFYVALIAAGYFDRRPCGCATAFEHLSWTGHLVINFVFTILGVIGFLLTSKNCGRSTATGLFKEDV